MKASSQHYQSSAIIFWRQYEYVTNDENYVTLTEGVLLTQRYNHL